MKSVSREHVRQVAVYHNPNDLRHDDANVRDAARFALGAAAIALAVLVTAAVWVSTCGGATADTVACGHPQRTALAFGAPAILFAAGMWAFARTYLAWRRQQTWWAWQGAGWVLLTLMLLVMTTSVGPVAGTGWTG